MIKKDYGFNNKTRSKSLIRAIKYTKVYQETSGDLNIQQMIISK